MNDDMKKNAGDSMLLQARAKRKSVDVFFSKEESLSGRVLEFDGNFILLERFVSFDEIDKSRTQPEIISRHAIKRIAYSAGYTDLVLRLINDSLKKSPSSNIIVSDVHVAFSCCFNRLDRDDYFRSLRAREEFTLLKNAAGFLSDFQSLLAGEDFDLRESGGFFHLHGYTINQAVTASMLGDVLEPRPGTRCPVSDVHAAFRIHTKLKHYNDARRFRALLEQHKYKLIPIRDESRDSYLVEDHAVKPEFNEQIHKNLRSIRA